VFFFFFSSRRRHTSFSRDWSSDVCSSDLGTADDIISTALESFDMIHVTEPDIPATHRDWWHDLLERLPVPWTLTLNGNTYPYVRSEERRVGEERRCSW